MTRTLAVVAPMCLLLAMTGTPATGATFYVDQSYGAGGNGSQGAPFDEIQEAVNALPSAEASTVYIRPGVYQESLNLNKVVDLVGESACQVRVQGGNPAVYIPADGRAQISGMWVSAVGDGILVKDRAVFRADNMVVSGCGLTGISVFSDGYDDPNKPVVTLYNCTIDSNGSGVYVDQKCSGSGYYKNADIYIFSTLVTRNGRGLVFRENCSNRGQRVIEYCDVWGNGTSIVENYVNCSPGIGCIPTGNPGEGVDPLYLNHCYHLQLVSPARNAGNPSASYHDPDGTRNDLGAYGGPGSAGFFPDPNGGPIVTDLSVWPPSVPRGEAIEINATGQTR